MNKLADVASAIALMLSIPTVSAADSFFDSIKEAGRTIGHASRDATREVGHAFRDGFSDDEKGKAKGDKKQKDEKKADK